MTLSYNLEKEVKMLSELERILEVKEYRTKLCSTTRIDLFRIMTGKKENRMHKRLQYTIKKGYDKTTQTLDYKEIMELVKNPEITYIERTH